MLKKAKKAAKFHRIMLVLTDFLTKVAIFGNFWAGGSL